MKRFEHRRICVAVSGGIAAYKACDLIRELYRQGAEQVVALMTSSSEAFITPLTLETLTRHPVYRTALENAPDGTPTHIYLAQHMDALVVAPATANVLAELAHGLSGSLLATTALSFTGQPVLLAPAMNTRMWTNPLVTRNVALLSELSNIHIVPPVTGDMACGETGDGKLAPIEHILDGLYQALHPHRDLLRGKHYIVTAGGTAEPIDTVRVLTNRSSGKMGLALADELSAMGARVTLIHTMPVENRTYPCIPVQTARQMLEAVLETLPHADGLLMAAAVADFEADNAQDTKIKKQDSLKLSLQKTPDILEAVRHIRRPDQQIVGFAAETHNVLDYAQEKLIRKNLDLLVANDVSRSDIGFNSDDNEVTLLQPNQAPIHIPKSPKSLIARAIGLTLASSASVASTLVSL